MDWKPDERYFDEAAKLWDETEEEKKEAIMEGGIRDGIYTIITTHEADSSPLWIAQRAAWLGYCIGAGLIKEGN